jgi:hypothetical protein
MSPHAITAVPTGTNNWWKEATVYQVEYSTFTDIPCTADMARYTPHHSKIPTAMDGVIFPVSSLRSHTSIRWEST